MILFARRISCILKIQLPDGSGHTAPSMRATNYIRALRVCPKP